MSERLKTVAKIAVVVVVGTILGALAVRGMFFWVDRMADWIQPVETVKEDTTPFTDLVQTSIGGVVHLQCPSWQGSGFVVGPRLIVTARHCVEGVEDFLITIHDGHQVRATRAISDKESDVAFIWVDDLECVAEGCVLQGWVGGTEERTFVLGEHNVVLSALPLGSIKDCVLGQSIYIVGSPYGFVNFNAVSKGIISGLGRDWDEVNPYTGESYGWSVCFTSDSSASPGNSGGPIFTFDGVVRGVLVGGYNSTVNCLMPCDLFVADLLYIEAMFKMDKYKREEIVGYRDPYYNYTEGHEYY